MWKSKAKQNIVPLKRSVSKRNTLEDDAPTFENLAKTKQEQPMSLMQLAAMGELDKESDVQSNATPNVGQ